MKIDCIKKGFKAGAQEYYVRFKGENTISITLTERDLLDLLSEVQAQLSKDDETINLLQMNRSIRDLTDTIVKLSNEIFELKQMSVPAQPQRYPWDNPVIYKTEPLSPGPVTCAEIGDTTTSTGIKVKDTTTSTEIEGDELVCMYP